jgi:YtkA-like
MRERLAILVALGLAAALAGCNTSRSEIGNLRTVETHEAGAINIVLMNEAGELKQGQNDFVVRFQDKQGRPVDVRAVQFGSSMAMPGMAPMSGDSEVTPAGQTGTYRVKSNFAMSGAWHFTVEWSGPQGQNKTAFNTNVR